MPKQTISYPRANEIPEVCEACGQKIDANSRASIEHHKTPRHPYLGKRKSGWR